MYHRQTGNIYIFAKNHGKNRILLHELLNIGYILAQYWYNIILCNLVWNVY